MNKLIVFACAFLLAGCSTLQAAPAGCPKIVIPPWPVYPIYEISNSSAYSAKAKAMASSFLILKADDEKSRALLEQFS